MSHASHGKVFLRALGGSAGVYLFGTAMGFLVGVQLARGLGVAGYGLYGAAMAAASLGATVAVGGLQLHATREIAVYYSQGARDTAARLVRWSVRKAVILGFISTLPVGGYVLLLQGATPSVALSSMVLTLLMAFLWLVGAIVRGTGKVVLGQALDVAIRPGVQSGLLLLGTLTLGALNPETALALSSVAIIVAMPFARSAMASILCTHHANSALDAEHTVWSRSSFTMGLATIVKAAEGTLPLIVIGAIATLDDAGLFRAATALAMLSYLPSSIVTVMVPALIYNLYAQRNYDQLRSITQLAGVSILVPTFFIAVIVSIFGSSIVGFTLGAEFKPAYAPFAILAWGSVANALGGISITLLHAGRYDVIVTKVFGLSLVATAIGLVIAGIAQGSIVYIAGFVSVVIALRTIALALLTRQLLGINPTLLGLCCRKQSDFKVK